MKISMIAQKYSPSTGGIITYFSKIAYHLNSNHCDIQVLAPKISFEDIKFDLVSEYKIKRFKRYNIKFVSRFIESLVIFKNIMKFKPNIVFFSQWMPYSIFVIIYCKLLRKKKSIKIVLGAHGSEILVLQKKYKNRKKLIQLLALYSLKQADKIIAVSNYTRNLVLNLIDDNSKVITIPNGVDCKEFENPDLTRAKLLTGLGLDHIKEKFIVLTLSYITKRKGHETVLSAFRNLINLPIHYLIAGEGIELNNLKQKVKENDLNEKVTFLGHVDPKYIASLYSAIDLFVMPSYEEENKSDIEGFGIVFLEANACKKAVIGTNCGGIPDAIINEETGYLIDSHDYKTLSDRIEYLYKNPTVLEEMGNNGFKRAKEKFSWEIVSNQLIEIFSVLIEE